MYHALAFPHNLRAPLLPVPLLAAAEWLPHPATSKDTPHDPATLALALDCRLPHDTLRLCHAHTHATIPATPSLPAASPLAGAEGGGLASAGLSLLNDVQALGEGNNTLLLNGRGLLETWWQTITQAAVLKLSRIQVAAMTCSPHAAHRS